MPVQFVSNHYRNELGNPGEKQVGMKRFLILGFTPGNTKTVFEMVDGFLNRYSDFVGGVPFIRTTDCTRVGTQIFLGIKIKHPAAGRFRTGIIAMADTLTFTSSLLYTHLILGHTNFMVGNPQRRCDLLPSRFIGREGSFGQQGMPFSFKGQSLSGSEILPLSGIQALSKEAS